MSYEELEAQRGELASKEELLRFRVLKRATFEYRKAHKLGQVQGFGLLVPEPTNAFRMVAKSGNHVGVRTEDRDDLFVYVPQSHDPESNQWIERMWTRFSVRGGSRVGMFEINQHYSGVYRPNDLDGVETATQRIQDDSGEVDLESLTLSAIASSTIAIQGLEALIKAMRDDFEHVPYDYIYPPGYR